MKMNKIKSFIFTVLGTMVTGFGIGVFLTPNKIVGGGVSGLSTSLYQTLYVPPGVSFRVINIIFLALGFKLLGKDFIIKTLLGASLLSIFVQIFSLKKESLFRAPFLFVYLFFIYNI